MKKIIRRGVFESNSSSSHSISIMMAPQEVKIPKKIHFRVHQFHDYPWDDDYVVITSDSSDAEAKRGKDRVYFDEFGEVKYGEE